MSDAPLIHSVTDEAIEIRFPPAKRGLLSRFVAKQTPRSFTELAPEDRGILFAMGDLRAWEDTHPGSIQIATDHVRMSHDAAASLPASSAEGLGLPRTVELTLKTDVTGVLGRPDFRLHYEWSRQGRRETPKRTGTILHTSQGPRRLPLWMKRALDMADGFDANQPLEDHWRALADFRRAIEPEANVDAVLSANPKVAGLSMTAFLRGLEVRIADRFSISPDANLGQFEVVPYSNERLESAGLYDDISEQDAELSGEALAVFQSGLHQYGAKPAYRLGNNAFLVIDKGAAPILAEMARVQKAPREERKAFVANPRAFITEAVNQHMAKEGLLDGLDDAQQAEMVEAIAGPGLIESREYSERVTGVIVYKRGNDYGEGSGTTWLPEAFAQHLVETIQSMPDPDLHALHAHMAAVIEAEADTPAIIGGGKRSPSPLPVLPPLKARFSGAKALKHKRMRNRAMRTRARNLRKRPRAQSSSTQRKTTPS